ncbi:MAG: peroxiredoxin [Coxiellaceae bacterium]|nr:MAG: peroxiredoxin [Coxiellaceae bacterium]
MPTATIDKPVANLALVTTTKTLHLADFKGKNVVLYFYPKDNTPGCTMESKGFRDHHADFERLNTVILGISRDSLASHEKFKTKHCFPFELVADTDGKVCEYFDVIKPTLFFGKKIQRLIRSTFLIDSNGTLRQEWRNVKVLGHVEKVLKAVRELQK